MPESDQNAALKVVIHVSEPFAKWLVPRWLIPLLALAALFGLVGLGAVALVERVSSSEPNPPLIEESRTVE